MSSMPYWFKIFNSLSREEKQSITYKLLEKLIEANIINYWCDDSVDKFGNALPDDVEVEEHFYWNDISKTPILEEPKITITKKDRSLSGVQPNPGWGNICVDCEHVFEDSKKYINFPPEYPCNEFKFGKSRRVLNIIRYSGDIEHCSSYKKK